MTKPSDPKHSETKKTIPIIEERVSYDTQREQTGRVRITKQVHEETVDVNESLTRENVQVERVPKDEFIDGTPPSIRHEGDVTIIPVVEEVLIKRLRLIEELHVSKTTETHTDTNEVVLRKEQLVVERDSPETKD